MSVPGDVVLARIPQANAPSKLRPALVLCDLPGRHGDVLACGVSTQIHQVVESWDERIAVTDADFIGSGLHAESIIRLSFLAVLAPGQIAGGIGHIAPERLARLRRRLGRHVGSVN
jgi:mRNA interferase MazF